MFHVNIYLGAAKEPFERVNLPATLFVHMLFAEEPKKEDFPSE